MVDSAHTPAKAASGGKVAATVDHREHGVLPPTGSDSETTAQKEAALSGPAADAQAWLDKAQAAISAKDVDQFVALFADNGWWKDTLNIELDFNSLKTADIKPYLNKRGTSLPGIQNLKVDRPLEAAIVPLAPGVEWLQSYLKFETDKTRGNGVLRLSKDEQGEWKAFLFFTVAQEVKGHEEFAYDRRPLGADHTGNVPDKNWLDLREEARQYLDSDPETLVVGGGQNGMMLAARLTALGHSTLLIDQHERIGDCWRKRYKSLVLHDPIHSDHWPYLQYPPQWPTFIPKDKLANWMESYVEAMEINYWTKSTIVPGATYDEKSGTWTVTVIKSDGSKRTMHPKFLVLATGFSGKPRLPTNFPTDEYQGTLMHSSQFKGADGTKGKKVVVVGTGNSGHDLASAFCSAGADITVVQRSHTLVMSSDPGLGMLLKGFYEEGIPTADGDLLFQSFPITLVEQYQTETVKELMKVDKPTHDGLAKAGFKVNPYPAGLFMKYFRDGGGYYIDIGASKLIADGKVKVKQGHEITKLTKDGLLFDDNTELKADVIVFATGYDSMRQTVSALIGDHVANKLGPVWGEDAQGEIPGVWRLNGQPGFFLQCGNFFQARVFSKHTALTIHLQNLGLADKNFPGNTDKRKADARF